MNQFLIRAHLCQALALAANSSADSEVLEPRSCTVACDGGDPCLVLHFISRVAGNSAEGCRLHCNSSQYSKEIRMVSRR